MKARSTNVIPQHNQVQTGSVSFNAFEFAMLDKCNDATASNVISQASGMH